MSLKIKELLVNQKNIGNLKHKLRALLVQIERYKKIKCN